MNRSSRSALRHSSSRSATWSLNSSLFSRCLLGEWDLLLDRERPLPFFLLLDLLLLPERLVLLVDRFLLLDLLWDTFGLLDRLFDFTKDLDFDLVADLFLSSDADCLLRLTESSTWSLETLLLLEEAIPVAKYDRLVVAHQLCVDRSAGQKQLVWTARTCSIQTE